MRAARLTGWREPLDIAVVDDPVPPSGGVVLRVLACGICRSDWHVWTGGDAVDLPHIPGHEFCGEVVALGAGVGRWRVGDRVVAPFILACGGCNDCASGHQTVCANQILPGFTAPGAFAEYVAVPFADQNLARLPEAVAPELAAAMGCRVPTAWQALTGRAALRGGEWVAIFGGGGVGLSALMLARALGARVVVVDVVDEKLEFARNLGADAVVNAAQCDAADAVREITGGGAHVSIEALGLPQTTEAALRACRKLGRMVQVGMPAGDHTRMDLPWDVVYSGQLAVYGTRGMPGHRYDDLFRMIDGGLDLSALIDRRVALSDATLELHAFDAPSRPGIAVITDFAA